MEFEKFMEKAMIQYLDKKVSEVADKVAFLREEFSMFEITSDYSKEVNNALRQGNVDSAKQILAEVREKYLQSQDDSISKKRLYAIMEELYERIKDYEGGYEKNSLLETIREYEKKALLKNPELFSKKDESVSLVISTINLKEKEIQDILADPIPNHNQIESAAKSYRELKELINRLPEEYSDLKGKMIEEATSTYNSIKDRLATKFGPNKEKNPEEEARLIDNRLAEIRMLKRKIIESHDAINHYLEKENLAGCVKEYRKLKKYCYLFPKDLSGERIALLSDTKSLYEKIHALKEKISDVNQSQLNKQKSESPNQLPIKTDLANSELIKNLKDKMAISLKIIEENIRVENLNQAAKEYENLKKMAMQFPSDPDPQNKVEALSTTLAVFSNIKKAKFNLEEKRKKEQIEIKENKSQETEFESYKNKLKFKIENVKKLIAESKTKDAIAEFINAKEFFNNYPDTNLDEKKILYDEIMNAHIDMAFINSSVKSGLPPEAFEKVNEIKKLIADAEKNIRSEKIQAAEGIMLEAKHKVIMLPKEDFDDKYALSKEIDYLEHQLIALKNISGLKSRYESTQQANTR